MLKYFVACSSLMIATAAVAQPAQNGQQVIAGDSSAGGANVAVDAAQVAAKPVSKADRKVCKQLPSSTSRLPNKVCMTAREWEQVENGD